MEAVGSSSIHSTDGSALAALEEPFVGRWNQLVSTTNWEKGRIIHEWRDALVAAEAPATEFSDEAWSRRVGGVTGQHVGRLRRVFHRFVTVRSLYPGLFWSHFQAALDWDDAEMWLEGAARSNWTVEAMRSTRAETLANVQDASPQAAVADDSDVDEDFDPGHLPEKRESASYRGSESTGPLVEGPDFGDDGNSYEDRNPTRRSFDGESHDPISLVQPFENLAELPVDFADAFDGMKLSILRHKSEGWQQIALADVLSALDALKELAQARL